METLSMEDEYDAYVKRAIHRHLYKHFWSRIDPGRALLYLCAMIVAGFLLASFIPALIFLERSYHYPPWLPTTVKIVLCCLPISLALLFEGLSYRFYRTSVSLFAKRRRPTFGRASFRPR